MDRYEIINTLKSYDPNFNEILINKAIDFAIHYHGSQTRESGEPYYHHPLQVAEIILQMHLDSNSVITALLHDTVEDTDLTLAEIEKNFGSDVAKLVDGVTKLSKIEFMPDQTRQAENFRKLLVALSEDIRVLLVKLADRLHNMRTIDHVNPAKQMRIAIETMEIYVPLAERIGIQQIKTELQDICFKIIHPEIRESIISRLGSISGNEDQFIEKTSIEIKNILEKAGIKADVTGRRKTPYSIWMKMKQKDVGLDQLSDIVAFRIIVDEILATYHALGIIHTNYKMVPDSFQDFISIPKNNGYKSIHTVVIGPLKQKIEVQIRTHEMHEIAELGVAAHWRYKQKYPDAADGKQYRWVRELLSILEQSSDPEDFLQNTKLAIHYDQVFCFTPKGNLIAMPKGATPIDFAYAVHCDVGHHCVGAKINGKIVPLSSILSNGDQIEILTSSTQVPSPAWEKFIVTGKARAEIRKFIRSQQRGQYIKLGEHILGKVFTAHNITDTQEALSKLTEFFKKKDIDELYYALGEGSLDREEIIRQIVPKKNKISSTLALLNFRKAKNEKLKQSIEENAIPIKGLIGGMAMHLASCCNPLPGDKIVGIIHAGSGVTVHISDCEMLDNFASIPDKILDLTWDSDKSKVPLICRLKVTLVNEPGVLAVITSEIAKQNVNITNFKVIKRNIDFCEVIFDLEVLNTTQVNSISQALKTKNSIYHIERLKL